MAITSIASATSGITTLSNLLLVTPANTVGYQPISPPGKSIYGTASTQTAPNPPSLLFHYEGEQIVEIESDITDHYVEDNTAIQDQIALKPEMITTQGFIGELNDVVPYGLQSYAAQAVSKLQEVSGYAPQLSITALVAYNEAFEAYQLIQNAVNSTVTSLSTLGATGGGGENVVGAAGIGSAVSLYGGSVYNNQNKQQVAFQQFYAYWRARWLFTVQTPWAVFQNMAIKSLRAVQDEKTNMITDFHVTFKMIRTTSSVVVTLSAAGRAAVQSLSAVDQGTQSIAGGTSVPFANALPA